MATGTPFSQLAKCWKHPVEQDAKLRGLVIADEQPLPQSSEWAAVAPCRQGCHSSGVPNLSFPIPASSPHCPLHPRLLATQQSALVWQHAGAHGRCPQLFCVFLSFGLAFQQLHCKHLLFPLCITWLYYKNSNFAEKGVLMRVRTLHLLGHWNWNFLGFPLYFFRWFFHFWKIFF